MKQQSSTATDEIEHACSHYLRQVSTVVPLDALSVVLLDPGEETGKVVFSWREPPSAVPGSQPDCSSPTLEQEPPSVLNITMYGSEGPIGGVLAHTPAPGGFRPHHCRLARDLAPQLAMSLENARLHQRLRASIREITLLDQVARIITSSPGLDEVAFHRLADAASKAVELDFAMLSWLELNGYHLRTWSWGTRLLKGRGFEVTLPILCGSEVISSLKVQRWGRPFATWENELLALVSNQIAPAVQSARYFQAISQQPRRLQPGDNRPSPGTAGQHRSMSRGPDSEVDLAHALCTPLTTIKGYASSLLQPNIDWPPELLQEFLKTINQAADRLGGAIRQLLLAEQSAPGPARARLSLTDLQPLLGQLEVELREELPSVSVDSRCSPGLPKVAIDQDLIRQAVRRLVEYVRDAALTPEAVLPEAVLVEACPADDGAAICLTVKRYGHSYQASSSACLPDWDTDLRVMACRNILQAHETILQIDTSRQDQVRVWFVLSQEESSDRPMRGIEG